MSSSNNLGYSDADWKQIQDNDAAVKEMEAAGIAWAAHLFEAPFFALKSITDIVDGDRPPQEEFLENLQRAAHALKVNLPPFSLSGLCLIRCLISLIRWPVLQDKLPPVIEFLAGKQVQEL